MESAHMFQIDQDVAEKIVKKAMTGLRERLTANEGAEVNLEVSMTLGEIKELDTDLGMLGMALAQTFKKERDMREAVKVVAEENERLNTTVDTLAEHLSGEKKYTKLLEDKIKEIYEAQQASEVPPVSEST